MVSRDFCMLRRAALLLMSLLLPASGAMGRRGRLTKDELTVSTEYGQLMLDHVSLSQSDKYVTLSGTIANDARRGWDLMVLALTFYGKSGDALPPEPGVSTFVRIHNLPMGGRKNFSEQVSWHLIRHKFRPPQGRIADFVVTYDSDDSHPSAVDHEPVTH
jgi:hypothetical protein